MLNKKYSVITAHSGSFEDMCKTIFEQTSDNCILKIVFFGSPADNQEYRTQLSILEQTARNYFKKLIPLISYVAQSPYYGELKAEVMSVEIGNDVKIVEGDNYYVIETVDDRELITGGVIARDIDSSIADQTKDVFSQIDTILAATHFSICDIVRQWNYIERIVDFDGEWQHYQSFNDGRTHFYNQVQWPAGYPAATGIGTQRGGIMVDFIAYQGKDIINVPLDNPLQVAAHNYSQEVLLGATDLRLKQRTTPKFERARVVGDKQNRIVYVSGTAAIRGEISVPSDDVIEQTRLTMENIEYLVSEKNYPTDNRLKRKYDILRIYMKNPEDTSSVRNFLNTEYPNIKKFFVHADVCRDELLIEIEGVVTLY